MGKTTPPFTQVLEQTERELKPYRRALRKEDQQALDRIFSRAKQQVAACSYAAYPWPMDLILVSALVEQEKLITRLAEDIRQLKETLDADRPGDAV